MGNLAGIEAAIVSLTPRDIEHLQNLLHELRARHEEARLEELYRHIGFVPLPKRTGPLVTREMVRQLREEEGS